jgi:hypothetical protein
VANLTQEIEINVPHSPIVEPFQTLECRFWDEQALAWSTQGCRLELRTSNGTRLEAVLQQDMEAVYDPSTDDPG